MISHCILALRRCRAGRASDDLRRHGDYERALCAYQRRNFAEAERALPRDRRSARRRTRRPSARRTFSPAR